MLNTRLILDDDKKGSPENASRVWARFAAAGIGLSFALGQTALGQSQLYAVTDLGTLDRCETCTSFRGHALNAFGDVTGFYFGADGNRRAFFWSDGTMIDLGTLGGDLAVPNSVNVSSDIVGRSRIVEQEFIEHAFLYSDGAMIDLGTLGGTHSSARDINNAGQVVGNAQLADPEPNHAFLWEDGVMTDLGTLGGAVSTAHAINDAGEVVGSAWNSAANKDRAFLWTAEVGMTELGDLGGESSQASSINILGQIVGSSQTDEKDKTHFIPFVHAFLWQNGEMFDLGVLPEAGEEGPFGPALVNTAATSINAAGKIVGDSNPPGERPGPFVIDDGGEMRNLNDLLVVGSAGWVISAADDINDFGQIAGTGRFDGGPNHAVRLDPITVIPADLVVDGQINAADLAVLLGAWGPCEPGEDCPADLDGNQVVDAADLAILLGAWGPYAV